MDKVKSIRFDKELERKIRILAAENDISFSEWIRMTVIEKVNNQQKPKD